MTGLKESARKMFYGNFAPSEIDSWAEKTIRELEEHMQQISQRMGTASNAEIECKAAWRSGVDEVLRFLRDETEK